MAEPQTAIILVTDLVGSTAQRTEVGEEAAEDLRRRHDGLLTDAVDQHEGIVVKSLGDGILARFAGASSAVAAAVSMQQRVGDEFVVRIGISAGDVTLEDGDCFGTPVIEASRLCDRAEGGQILVAELARMLARGRGGHVFEPVGEFELKGLADPVVTSQVAWEPVLQDHIRFPAALRRAEGLPFAGRIGALEEMTLTWKSAVDGGRRIVLLSGEPGMGKTRLAIELAEIAHDGGGTVLFGRSDDEVTTALRPFTEALGPLIADLPDDVIAAHADAFGGALLGIVPALSTRVDGLDAPGGTAEETRLVVYDAVADLLGRASRVAPVLLVLDDLHWADDGTVLLVKHLARRRDLGSVLVVGTYRDTDLDRTHRLSSVLADLRRVEGVERVPLDGLDIDEVVSLMASAGGHDLDERGAELARLVHSETEGNPFFIGEVLRHLAESGAIYEADGRWVSDAESIADIGVPQGIREVVGRRLDALPDETNRVLRAAAVIGQDFDLTVLANTLDRSVDDVLDDLDPALDRNLLTEVPGEVDRLRFPHALVRQTLYEELSTSRRVRFHARIADAFGRAGGDVTAERAHHLLEAAAVVDLDSLVDAVADASATARRAIAWETAIDWIERGQEAVADSTDERPDLDGRLLLALAETYNESGDLLRSTAAARDAARIARANDLPKLLASAAATQALPGAWLEIDATDGLESIAEAEAALEPGDSPERADLLVARAHLSIHDPDPAHSIRAAREGLDMVRRTGSSRLVEALLTFCDNLRGEPVPDELLAMAREIAEVESTTRRHLSLYYQADAHVKWGRFDEVQRLTDEMFEVGRRTRSALVEWQARTVSVGLHLHAARWDDAEAALARLAEIDHVMGDVGLGGRWVHRMRLGLLQGDHEAAAAAKREVLEAIPTWVVMPFDMTLDEAAGTAGPDELGAAAATWLDEMFPLLPCWGHGSAVGFAAPVLRYVTPETAGRFAEIIEPSRGLWLSNAAEFNSGHSGATLGAIAMARGDLEAAIADFGEALAAHDAAGEVPARAQFAVLAIEALVQRDAAGDRDHARRLSDEVAATCERHGISGLIERAAALID